MAVNHGSRERRPSPSFSFERSQATKVVRVRNSLQQEPRPQSAISREHRFSMVADTDYISTAQTRRDVAELIERFEKPQSTVNAMLVRPKPPGITSSTVPVQRFQSSVKLRIVSSVHAVPESIIGPNDLVNHDDPPAQSPNSSEARLSQVPESVQEDATPRTSVLSEEDSLDSSSSDEEAECADEKKMVLTERNNEVYDTERTYMEKLRVLAYILPQQLKDFCQKDQNLLRRFRHAYRPLKTALKEIYIFHVTFILPRMEQYQVGSCTEQMWTIFEDHYQTMERLYKAYYISYDENQRRLSDLCKPGSLLDKAMLECQALLGNLYPLAELNCANQRLLRYILLIENQMKRLDESSSEYQRMNSIRNELKNIATRCEDELVVSPSQVKKLKGCFDNKLDYFKNQRLLWHGELKWRSPRRRIGVGQYYLLLFSKCLLICDESGEKLELNKYLSIGNITIDALQPEQTATSTSNALDKDYSSVTVFPFRVNAFEESCEFLVEKESDRQKWINKIKQAADRFKQRNADVEVRQSHQSSHRHDFGIRAPAWVNDNDVTRCQICHDRFGHALIRPRHHCRSCGRCVCSACSTKKLTLRYCAEKGDKRVCDTCYGYVTGVSRNSMLPSKQLRNPDRTILFGDFEYTSTGLFVWIDLQEDHCLHIYGAKLDQLEDFSINLVEFRDMSLNEKTCTLSLNTKDKTHKFTLKENHQVLVPENDPTFQYVKNTTNKALFYARLWYDAMQLARFKTVPSWYKRKRDSVDSGTSTGS